MGELAIIYLALAVTILGAQYYLYRKPKSSGLFFFNVVVALVVAFLSFSSRASNDTTGRIIALVLGAISLVALLPRYSGTLNFNMSNVLVTLSVAGGFIFLVI